MVLELLQADTYAVFRWERHTEVAQYLAQFEEVSMIVQSSTCVLLSFSINVFVETILPKIHPHIDGCKLLCSCGHEDFYEHSYVGEFIECTCPQCGYVLECLVERTWDSDVDDYFPAPTKVQELAIELKNMLEI